jgi:hypothetical protein
VLLDAVALALLVDVLVLVLVVVDELDEEHAARATAKTASPAVVTCRLPRKCISGTPYRFYRFGPRRAAWSSFKPLCASTVCRRRRYLRVNPKWTKRGQKVNFWCLRANFRLRPAARGAVRCMRSRA